VDEKRGVRFLRMDAAQPRRERLCQRTALEEIPAAGGIREPLQTVLFLTLGENLAAELDPYIVVGRPEV
jgi:hypothetical protein